jgi:hypothetical protein
MYSDADEEEYLGADFDELTRSFGYGADTEELNRSDVVLVVDEDESWHGAVSEELNRSDVVLDEDEDESWQLESIINRLHARLEVIIELSQQCIVRVKQFEEIHDSPCVFFLNFINDMLVRCFALQRSVFQDEAGVLNGIDLLECIDKKHRFIQSHLHELVNDPRFSSQANAVDVSVGLFSGCSRRNPSCAEFFLMASSSKANLPALVEVTPQPLMICDGPVPAIFAQSCSDSASLAQRLKMASQFGGAKLFEFENPYFGLSQIQFDYSMDRLYGPISIPTGGTRMCISPESSSGNHLNLSASVHAVSAARHEKIQDS